MDKFYWPCCKSARDLPWFRRGVTQWGFNLKTSVNPFELRTWLWLNLGVSPNWISPNWIYKQQNALEMISMKSVGLIIESDVSVSRTPGLPEVFFWTLTNPKRQNPIHSQFQLKVLVQNQLQSPKIKSECHSLNGNDLPTVNYRTG